MYNTNQVTLYVCTAESQSTSSYSWLQNESYKQSAIFHESVSKNVIKPREPDQTYNKKSVKRKHKHKEDKRDREKRKKAEKLIKAKKDSIYAELAKKTFFEETGLAPERAFCSDRKPDRNNLAFDTIYRLKVPQYKKQSCIISYRYERDRTNKRKNERFFSPKSVAILENNKNPIDMSRPSDTCKPSEDFIKLSDSLVSSQPLEQAPDIIQFQSMMQDDLKNDSTKRFPVKPSIEQQLYNLTQEYNEYLRRVPSDVQKWLAFVEFQDRFANQNQESLRIVIIEKKLSVIQKAIENNPNSLELLLSRLDLATSIWEPEKINNEWMRLTFLHPTNTEIWTRYVKFVRSHLTFFSTSKVLKIYCKCFSTMISSLESAKTDHLKQELEMNLIEIFQSYTLFLENVGICERAVASYQALIEFNLFTPKLLMPRMPLREWLTYFEPFWDSGVPRIGEPDWVSWSETMEIKKFVRAKDESFDDQYNIKENELIASCSDSTLAWLRLEDLRESYHWLPVKGEATESVEDFDRNVLLDDISVCLFRVLSKKSKFHIICNFIDFFAQSKLKNYFLKDYQVPVTEYMKIEHFLDNLISISTMLFPEEQFIFKQQMIEFKLEKWNADMSVSDIKELEKQIDTSCKTESDFSIQSWRQMIQLQTLVSTYDGVTRVYEAGLLKVNCENKSYLLEWSVSFAKHILRIESLDLSMRMASKEDDESAVQLLTNALINEKHLKITPTIHLKLLRSLNKHEDKPLALEAFALIVYISNGMDSASKLLEDNSKKWCCEERVLETIVRLRLLDIQRNLVPLRKLRFDLDRALMAFPTNKFFLETLLMLDSKAVISNQARRFV